MPAGACESMETVANSVRNLRVVIDWGDTSPKCPIVFVKQDVEPYLPLPNHNIM